MTTTATIATTFAALLLTASCGGQPKVLEPEGSASTTSSVASPSTPPAIPAAAKERSQSGAANFVLYWVKAAEFSTTTGDVSSLEAASTSDCVSCVNLIKNIRTTYKAGGRFSGGERTISKVSTETSSSTADVLVHTTTQIAESTHQPDRRSSAKKIPAEEARVTYRVTPSEDGWKLKEFAVDA